MTAVPHPFADLRAEYEGWVAACTPLPGRLGELDAVAKRLTRPEALANFGAVRNRLAIPEVWQAASFERECHCDFARSPAQGDRWDRVSVHVPKGRGPFRSWLDAAVDAYHDVDRVDDNYAPWSLAYACWKWEAFNGFGYRARGKRTPYVVGGTNLQQSGKYVADGKWDPDHVDQQLGCLPIALRMIEMVPSLAFGDAVRIAAPSIVPAVAPVPLGVGAGLTGCKWVQTALNAILDIDPPLVVDGSYGRKTRAAVRQAQAAFGLAQNGLVDSSLCAAIDARLAAMRPVA